MDTAVTEDFPRPAAVDVLSLLAAAASDDFKNEHIPRDCSIQQALERGNKFASNESDCMDLLRAAAYFFSAACQGNDEGDQLFKKLLPPGATSAPTADGPSGLPGLWKLFSAATQQDDCDAAASLASVYESGCAGVLQACPAVAFAWHVVSAASAKHAASAVKVAEGFLGFSTATSLIRHDLALGYLSFASQQTGPAARHAQLLLGECAAKGHGMPASRLRALLYWNSSQWEGPVELLASCRAQFDAMEYTEEEQAYACQVAVVRQDNDGDALFRVGAQAYQGKGGIATDNELAYSLFMEAARFHQPRAMSQLGFMSATGRGTPKSEVTALHWLRMSAEAGHGTSMFNYARQCEQGLGLPGGKPDHTTAIHWYERAAEGPYPNAINNLALQLIKGRGGEHRREEGLQLLYRAADPRGRALLAAQVSLGLVLEGGRPEYGIARRAADAVMYLREAFAGGRYDSAAAYARCMLWGRGVKKHFEGARAILVEAVEQGENKDCAAELLHWMSYGTGGFPVSGDGVLALGLTCAELGMWEAVWTAMLTLTSGTSRLAKAPKQALQLCRAGIESGEARFHCHLSFVLYTGLGCDVDFDGARAAAQIAAEDGHSTGISNFAEMLWQGLGGPHDQAAGLEWMEKAALKTHDASTQLLFMLAKRQACIQDSSSERSLVEQTAAAELGDAQAMLWLLHRAYLGDDGVCADNDELARLVLRATNGGKQLMEGLPPYVWTMYAVAQGPRTHSVAALPIDDELAADTLLRAAEAGCGCAAYCVGMYYLRGGRYSKHKNVVQAARWLRRAEELQHPLAAMRMDEAGIVH